MSRYMMNKFIRAVEMSTANVNAYVADTEGSGWRELVERYRAAIIPHGEVDDIH
ncbi:MULTISPECIES: hypothetical protein [Microbacterium]|uniref:hypothetical protein n=1 Tax=Microbacterium TaxID=33882 RepID=UPI001C62BD2D|nr:MULTISPECIES: hypothetical protein [Microbacterium]QYG12386.1 hypothetical protein KY497_03625 [Microbacterium sp. PAMC22086]